MDKEEAKEIIRMNEECKNRENACQWFCDICEFGQYSRDDLEEAKKVLKEV